MKIVDDEHVDGELRDAWATARTLLPGDLLGWSVRLRSDLDGDGLCTPGAREILVSTQRTGTERTVTVIHERAHALAGGGHGKVWQTLMARSIAECRDADLRQALREDLDNYAFSRSSGVQVANDLVWSAAKNAAGVVQADLGGIFAVLNDLHMLCLSFEHESLMAEKEAGIASLPPRVVQPREKALPELQAAQAAARVQVRRAVDYMSRQFAVQRREVLEVFPELTALLQRLSASLPPEPWPDLDPRHFV